MSGFMIGPIGVLPSASVAATTWNGSDATSGLAVSNAGRTFTYAVGGNTIQAIRSVNALTSNQKVYIEHVIGTMLTSVWFGFAPSNMAISSTNLIGAAPSYCFAVNASNGKFADAESADDTLTIIPACVAGDRIGLAYDDPNKRLYARKNGGGWNVSNGGGDPVAGTGGMRVVTSLAVGNFYAYAFLDANNGDTDTTNFASSSWVDAAPSGYTQLS